MIGVGSKLYLLENSAGTFEDDCSTWTDQAQRHLLLVLSHHHLFAATQSQCLGGDLAYFAITQDEHALCWLEVYLL